MPDETPVVSQDAGAIDYDLANPLREALEKLEFGEEAPAEPTPTPDEVAPSTPQPKNWKEQVLIPEDAEDAHGFLKGKPAEVVDRSFREAERAKQEAEVARNRAEQELGAARTLIDMMKEELERSRGGAKQVAQPEPTPREPNLDELDDVDLAYELAARPKEVLAKIREAATQDALKKIEAERQAEMTKYQRQLMQEEAIAALKETGEPEDRWESILDLMLPTLMHPNGKWASKGGALTRHNYLGLYDEIWPGKRGAKPTATPEPEPIKPAPQIEPDPAPPGSVPRRAESRIKPENTINIGREERSTYESVGRMRGLTGPELEDFVRRSATATRQIARNRRF